MVEITDIVVLRAQIGQEIAISDWLLVSQQRINQFAETTEDRQWIHIDPARAATDSPFKTTIAHGFLTLSLVSVLTRAAISFTGQTMAINYGVNRVRFVSPVPAAARIRGRFTPLAVDDVSGGVQVTWGITVEREGGTKPACTVEWLVRYYR
jgi:acyl dehydratase